MRLIDADEAGKYLYEHLDDLHMIAAQNAIDEMPTIDAQPVKRGWWIQIDADYRGMANDFKCSACKMITPYYKYTEKCGFDFCPHCGAKMCGGDADGDQV